MGLLPGTGSITVGGQDITKLRDHALIKYRGKQIGFVFQNYNLVPNLTALENVMLPMEFARALANKPDLILADEPTGNLDSTTGKMIFDLLHKLAKSENTTIIAVTHDLSIAGRTDVSFQLRDGKLVEHTN